MISRPPRSTQSRSSAASDVYKRQFLDCSEAQIGDVYNSERPASNKAKIDELPTSVVGHSLPIHSAPMSTNVRYAPNSDHSRHGSELTRCAKSDIMRVISR